MEGHEAVCALKKNQQASMPRISSILGRGSTYAIQRVDCSLPAQFPTSLRPTSRHPHRDDLHFEHPTMPNTLRPYDIYITFA